MALFAVIIYQNKEIFEIFIVIFFSTKNYQNLEKNMEKN